VIYRLDAASKCVIYTSKFSVLANHYSLLEEKRQVTISTYTNNITLQRSQSRRKREARARK
jgi:hypothetical protein